MHKSEVKLKTMKTRRIHAHNSVSAALCRRPSNKLFTNKGANNADLYVNMLLLIITDGVMRAMIPACDKILYLSCCYLGVSTSWRKSFSASEQRDRRQIRRARLHKLHLVFIG